MKQWLLNCWRQVWRDDLGADLAEYALLIGLVALVIVSALTTLGGNISAALSKAGQSAVVSNDNQSGSGGHATKSNNGKGDKTGNEAGSGSGTEVLYSDHFDKKKDNTKWYNRGKWKWCHGAFCGGGRWDYAVTGDAHLRDFDYSVRLRSDKIYGREPWNGSRVVFRFHDSNNYYALVPRRNGVLELGKMEHGVWHPALATAKGMGNPKQWQNYRVVATGNTITTYLNGKKMMRYVDPHPISAGRVGVINDNSRARFDDVVVKPVMPTLPVYPSVRRSIPGLGPQWSAHTGWYGYSRPERPSYRW